MTIAECGTWWTGTYANSCIRCRRKGNLEGIPCDCCSGVGIHRTKAATVQANPARKRPNTGFVQSNRRAFNA